jgi:hypothetical protein
MLTGQRRCKQDGDKLILQVEYWDEIQRCNIWRDATPADCPDLFES